MFAVIIMVVVIALLWQCPQELTAVLSLGTVGQGPSNHPPPIWTTSLCSPSAPHLGGGVGVSIAVSGNLLIWVKLFTQCPLGMANGYKTL